MKNKRNNNLGYIKEKELFFDDLNIDENNVINVEDINNNFEYTQPQEIENVNEMHQQEEFDYTFLKIIVFLIFV
jgi:hypothetical protein